jgi:hypothetical protein
MSVVTMAIITMLVNSVGSMMPRCNPRLRMMRSIKLRAFISEPMAAASRFGSPLKLAVVVRRCSSHPFAERGHREISPYLV